jgi:hypothetical protein
MNNINETATKRDIMLCCVITTMSIAGMLEIWLIFFEMIAISVCLLCMKR